MTLAKEEIIYPSSDGKPIADSTLQYQWITKIKGSFDTPPSHPFGEASYAGKGAGGLGFSDSPAVSLVGEGVRG